MELKKKVRPAQLNKFMHPRNPYKFVSFKQLAISYPEFRLHCTYDVSGKIYLDFKNIKALKALTTVLLDRDYGLKVSIPEKRLVPTLPLRMNYLLWMEDLLSLIHGKSSNMKRPTLGFDIGTGATCVYPFIGAKKNGWYFIATETDDVSFESAKENVTRNDLENFILLKKSSNFFDVLNGKDVLDFVKRVKSKQELSATTIEPDDHVAIHSDVHPSCVGSNRDSYLVDFTMCNPPFFSSEAEMDPNHNSKKETRSQPVSASTGSFHERVTDGGEIAFITKIIDESLRYKRRVRIFSTLIGVKNHVKPVVRLIKEKVEDSFVCISETEFCQGRTMRWGVAWTFDPNVPLQKVLSKKQQLTQKPMVLHIPRTQMSSYTVQTVWVKVQSWLKTIKIKPQLVKKNKYFVGATIRAYKATWLHQRQKRRKKMASSTLTSHQSSDGVDDKIEKNRNEEAAENEENPEKKPRLDLDETSTQPSQVLERVTDQLERREEVRDVTSEDVITLQETSAVNHIEANDVTTEVAASSGPECLLRAWLSLKQTEALISVQLKYLSGTGNKETVNQLLQYLKNRMLRGD